MDNKGTYEAAVVDLNASVHQVPENGFEIVRGFRTKHGAMATRCFLVRRSGQDRVVKLPEDFYLKFSDVNPVNKDAILEFADRFGSLRYIGSHFHAPGDAHGKEGEDITEWKIEIDRLRTAIDLWFAAKIGDKPGIHRLLQARRKTGKPWILVSPLSCMPELKDELELAKMTVIVTVSAALRQKAEEDTPCMFPGCGSRGGSARSGHDYTTAWLRPSKGRDADLVVVPSNLIKAIWLQFAAVVAGQRKLKKCEAPDCARYMDVTGSPRPGACRMHSSCEERWRKRRYRESLRSQSENIEREHR